MAIGQNFTNFDNQRRQRGSNLNHHHFLHHNHQVHPNHILHHQINNQTPFNSHYLSPIARAYQHLTATLPNATQTHHFHHNNAFHNAKTCESLHEDDSLSSVSMLSSEQAKRKVRWILSLGLLLPALAAIIGVVAWAVSAEVVMGVQREAALKNQQNNHLGHDDFLLNQLETRKLTVNSDRLKLNKQNNRGFGDRLSLNVRPQASTESKEHLSSSKTNELSPNNDILNLKNNTADNSKFDEMDSSKNSLENQKLDNKLEQENKKDDLENLQDVNVNQNSNKKNESEVENLDEETKNNEEDDKLDEKVDENTNDNLSENLKENLEEKTNDNLDENLKEILNENTKNKNFLTSKITTKSFKDKNGNEVKTFNQDIFFNQSKSSDLVNKDKNDKIDNLKKSAGAQVAEVIDKLVAQRNGVAPHIVVVAPFKLKDGKKKVTLTSGNVHEVPSFGSKSISAESLVSQLNKNQKDNEKNSMSKDFTILSISTNKVSTTTSPTSSVAYKGRSMQEEETEDLADSDNGNNEEDENAEEDENSKKNENDTKKDDSITENEEKETLKIKENDDKLILKDLNIKNKENKDANEKDEEEKSNDENKEDQETSSEDEDFDEKETSTTSKPVLVNRIKEAVRNTKTDKNLMTSQSHKREKPKNTNTVNEIDLKKSLKNSVKNKVNQEDKNIKPKTRTRKTNLLNKNNSTEKNQYLKKKNLVNLHDNIRRFDDDLPSELNLNFNKEFLKGSFLKKSSTSEQGFKQEKRKNLNYHEEFIHQSKEQETIYSLPTIDRKQTIKPPIGLQLITQPSSPPPVAHKNQVNFKFIPKKPIIINFNENKKNIKQKLDVLRQNDYSKIQQKIPYQNSFNGFNINLNKPNPTAIFNNKAIPQPRLEKHLHKPFSTLSSPSEQQKKQLLHLLQANSIASNQIQRSMNFNTGYNQLNQPNFSSKNQRSSHIPKNQLIQHLQMLSNLNLKNPYSNYRNELSQQNQIPPKFFELAQSMNAVPLPSVGPNRYTDMNQMIDVKLPPNAMNVATEHYQDDNLNNGNVFTESNDHVGKFHSNNVQNQFNNQNSNNVFREINLLKNQPFSLQNSKNHRLNPAESNTNLQTAESIEHTHHSTGANNLLSVADSSNSAVMNFNLKDPPNSGKGLHMSFGGGPSSGGAQLITNPMGIFKSLLLPLLPKPRMNLNGKVVFGVVLEKGVGFGKPKPSPPPVIVMPPSKHSFFG